MTRPANTIVSNVPPWYLSIQAAPSSDKGIATLLMSAVRQSARNTMSTMTTSTQPKISARLRLASDISMNVAGLKMVGSTLMSPSAGFRL